MSDTVPPDEVSDQIPDDPAAKDKGERREIKGGLPYTPSPGIFKKSLEAIIPAERPDKFTGNYMATVLKLTGGSARAVPPLLKKMNFIGADGTPTLLYSKFKTDGGRSQAAYDGLKSAFAELFRRNEYIYKADEAAVKDVIIEITGLKKSDNIVKIIYQTFDAIRGFISEEVGRSAGTEPNAPEEPAAAPTLAGSPSDHRPTHINPLGLHYNINIVLPETENVAVLNAIFRSLRDNLLRP